MENPFKAATIRQSFGDNMKPRFVVILDQDAAEIMGETKLRYVFNSIAGAQGMVDTLQANLDAAYADACGV